MRRAAFLAVTGITTSDMKNFARRGVLPLAQFSHVVSPDGPDNTDEPSGEPVLPLGADSGWREYGAGEAVRVAVWLRLTAQGLPQPFCGLLVRKMFTDCVRPLGPTFEDESVDLWFGAADASRWRSRASVIAPYVPVFGRLADLKIRNGRGSAVQEHDLAKLDGALDALMLVNVSQAIRETVARAETAGVADEFVHVWRWL